jgi:molybdenum cofactor cytidylyltransferase
VIQWATVKAGCETRLQVAAVVLAAGGSERMGQPKQLLPLGGQPMVCRVTERVCAAGLAQVVVVVGAHADAVSQALGNLAVEIVVNRAWAGGLSTSLRAGVGALRSEIQAAIVVLADQPALAPSLLRALVARYQATGALIVAPFYQGQRGNPMLFDRMLFPELSAIEGDRGGRELLARYRDQLERVEIDDPALLIDVDTLQDYERIRKSGIES